MMMKKKMKKKQKKAEESRKKKEEDEEEDDDDEEEDEEEAEESRRKQKERRKKEREGEDIRSQNSCSFFRVERRKLTNDHDPAEIILKGGIHGLQGLNSLLEHVIVPEELLPKRLLHLSSNLIQLPKFLQEILPQNRQIAL